MTVGRLLTEADSRELTGWQELYRAEAAEAERQRAQQQGG